VRVGYEIDVLYGDGKQSRESWGPGSYALCPRKISPAPITIHAINPA
jgi:hypothetical protein